MPPSYVTLLYFFGIVDASFDFAVRHMLMCANASQLFVIRLQATAGFTKRPENAEWAKVGQVEPR